jgi:hypothetical protein
VTGEDVGTDPTCTESAECADLNPCTLDYCHESFHFCVNEPLDGVSCDDGDLCNGVATCNAAGECVNDSSPLCDDGNDCTFDTCVSSGADCTWDPAPVNGTPCDNGLYCDGTSNVCDTGYCVNSVPGYLACDDFNLCTLDICTEGPGAAVCEHEDVSSFRAFTCGGTLSGTTNGPGDSASYGSCSGSLVNGPEEVLMFVSDAAVDVTFTLVADPVPTAENNEMYVLTDGCDPSTCTGSGTPSVTVTGVAAGTPVYVTVESVEGGAYFAVQATCS